MFLKLYTKNYVQVYTQYTHMLIHKELFCFPYTLTKKSFLETLTLKMKISIHLYA